MRNKTIPFSPLSRPGSTDDEVARRWFWAAFAVFVVGLTLGMAWDRGWHNQNGFDGFLSPPHVLLYATVILVALMVMRLFFTLPLRLAFGVGAAFKPFPFPVPLSLLLMVSGLLLLGLAGTVFDNLWHSLFGLDETGWSFPHALMNWSVFVIFCGFLAGGLALSRMKPLVAWQKWALAVTLLWAALHAITGPLLTNRSPELTEMIYTGIPALARQAEFQHIYRIYDQWNLNRTHPLFIPLLTLWFGLAVGLLRRLDFQGYILIAVLLTIWVLDTGSYNFGDVFGENPGLQPLSARSTIPIPLLLPTILAFSARYLKVRRDYIDAVTAALFAFLIMDTWDSMTPPVLMAVVAVPCMLVGRYIGDKLYERLYFMRRPDLFPFLAVAVALPMLTGYVDWWMRTNTP